MRIYSGKYKNQKLQTPKGLETRPTTGQVREAIFNILGESIQDAMMLDLFAGSGAVGFEALSHGAAEAIFVDSSRKSIDSIKANIEKLAVGDQAKAFFGDVYATLKKLEKKGLTFDLIFADPPYTDKKGELSHGQQLLEALDASSLLDDEGEIWLEESTHFEPQPLKRLQLVDQRKYGRSCLFRYRGLCPSSP